MCGTCGTGPLPFNNIHLRKCGTPNCRLFAGHDDGATNWGVIASLIETCKLNSVDPHAYLTDTVTAIVAGHKQSQINDLLPWNYAK